jgi:formylmethanofuran dehydrogenase subunit D
LITPQTESTSLPCFFSFGYVKKTETKKKIDISRFITPQTESTPLPCFSPSVT